MSNFSCPAGILALALILLSSCKSVRRVTHVESRGASDPLTKRFVGGSVERWESGKTHAMGSKHTSVGKIFGGTGKNMQFGGNYRSKQNTASGRTFSGSKPYKTGSYRSIEKWSGAKKSSTAAGKKFQGGGNKAHEGQKKWFGGNRKVSPRSAREGGKWLPLKLWRGVRDAPDANREVKAEVVNPDGSPGAPGHLSIEDVRGILGR